MFGSEDEPLLLYDYKKYREAVSFNFWLGISIGAVGGVAVITTLFYFLI